MSSVKITLEIPRDLVTALLGSDPIAIRDAGRLVRDVVEDIPPNLKPLDFIQLPAPGAAGRYSRSSTDSTDETAIYTPSSSDRDDDAASISSMVADVGGLSIEDEVEDEEFRINVRLICMPPGGPWISLYVRGSTTPWEVKQMIEVQQGIPAGIMRLRLDTHVIGLENDLKPLSIVSCTLLLNLKHRG